MKEHFQKLRQVMDDYEEACEVQLKGLLAKQDEKL
jgi:hypothetical protein